MSFLTEHKNDCSPVKPCSNCQAVSFLRTHLRDEKFREFIDLLGDASDMPAVEPIPLETKLIGLLEFQAMNIRTRNCFKNDKIETVADLVRHTEASVLRIPNFGRASLSKVNAMLSSIGHRLGELPWEPRQVA